MYTKLTIFLSFVFLSLILLSPAFAQNNLIGQDELSKHVSVQDCWVSFEGSVYNITDYIKQHNERFLEITSWCGKDITKDFQTKAGQNENHKNSTYVMLETYKIGTLDATPQSSEGTQENKDTTTNNNQITSDKTAIDETRSKNPYNFWLPFLGVSIPFFITWRLTKLKFKDNSPILARKYFNFFWNFILLFSTIPSGAFGLFMILRYSHPDLNNINFDFLYWHVEGGIVFVTLSLGHFLIRIKSFLAPVR